MVLLVPYDDNDLADGADAQAGDGADSQQKAQLDSSEAVRAAQKVDLDLDDAPFLEEEAEEAEEPEEEAPAPTTLVAEEEKKPPPAWLKNKLLYVGIAVFLLVTAVVLKFFVFTGEKPQEEVKPPEPTENATTPAAPPAPPPPPEPGETVLRLDPFWVEQTDSNSTVRFIVARFALTTKEDRLAVEFRRKIVVIRDSVYYYMRNKNYQFLSNLQNHADLKKDLLAVINQYLSGGQFETLLIEDYLIK